MSKRQPRRTFSADQINQIYEEQAKGLTIREIARRLKMETSTVHYWVHKKQTNTGLNTEYIKNLQEIKEGLKAVKAEIESLKAIFTTDNNTPKIIPKTIPQEIYNGLVKAINTPETKPIGSGTLINKTDEIIMNDEPIIKDNNGGELFDDVPDQQPTGEKFTTQDGYYTAQDAAKRVGIDEGNLTRKKGPGYELSIHAYNKEHPGELKPIEIQRPKNLKKKDGSIATTKTEVYTPDQWKLFFNWRNSKTKRNDKYSWD